MMKRILILAAVCLPIILFCTGANETGPRIYGTRVKLMGGLLDVVNKTSAPAVPDADSARLYYLDADGDDAVDSGDGFYIKLAGGTVLGPYVTSAPPADATYITQTANGTLTAEQAMGALASGLVYNTTTTGVQSIATMGTTGIDLNGSTLDFDATEVETVTWGASTSGAFTFQGGASDASITWNTDDMGINADILTFTNGTFVVNATDVFLNLGSQFTQDAPLVDFDADTSITFSSPYLRLDNDATGPGQLQFFEDSDNGSNRVAVIVPASLGANTTYTLPTVARTGLTSNPGSTLPLLISSAGAESTGSLTVAQGGTGVTTITGLVKGNGTSAMSAATAGTDYIAPSTTATHYAYFNYDDFLPGGTATYVSATDSGATPVFQTTNEQCFKYWLFASNASNYIQVQWRAPGNYNGGTITVQMEYFQSAAGTGDVKWSVDARAYTDNETLDAAWGTAQTVTDAALNDATKLTVTAATPAITIAGTPAAGERIWIRVARLGADAADTLTRTSFLVGLRVGYTTNAYSE